MRSGCYAGPLQCPEVWLILPTLDYVSCTTANHRQRDMVLNQSQVSIDHLCHHADEQVLPRVQPEQLASVIVGVEDLAF